MAVKCWASILGDCDGEQSGEHVVSEGLFRGKAVDVRGFHWCAGEFKTIGLNGLEANVLCKRHNNALSPLDQAAQDLQEDLREFTGEVEDVYRCEGLWLGPRRFEVDGEKIARWIVKTHCDIYADTRQPLHESWIRYAFDREGAERPLTFVREPRAVDWRFVEKHVVQYRDFPFVPDDAKGTPLEQHAVVYCRFHGIEFLVAPAAVGPWLFEVLQQLVEDPAMFAAEEWDPYPNGLFRGQRSAFGPNVRTRELTFRWSEVSAA